MKYELTNKVKIEKCKECTEGVEDIKIKRTDSKFEITRMSLELTILQMN